MFLHVALVDIASGKTFAVQRGLVRLLLFFPYFGAVGEADAQGCVRGCVGGRSANVMQPKFTGDFGVGDDRSLRHVDRLAVLDAVREGIDCLARDHEVRFETVEWEVVEVGFKDNDVAVRCDGTIEFTQALVAGGLQIADLFPASLKEFDDGATPYAGLSGSLLTFKED
ncbi:hypothetical protein PQR66_08665 [Paraburkholderia agricolaris]|uniref:Uncharacterized protein n=1 Tax=Paraburkholderia agricolaris TaxID=2152888 RepID=A0ABW8ZKH5_9BURK